MRRDAGGVERTLFGLSINVMPFDYGFSFAGHRATAHNLSLGPVEDLSISVYDRADGRPLRIDFDANPALHTQADLAGYRQRFLRLLTALADAERPIGNLELLERAERDTILRQWNDTARPIAAGDRCPSCSPRRPRARRTPPRSSFEDRHADLRARSTPMPTAWRIICAASASGRRPWWGSASSARRRCWSGCSASSRPAAPICRSTPVYPRERLGSCWPTPACRAGDAVRAGRSAAGRRPPHADRPARRRLRRRSRATRDRAAARPRSAPSGLCHLHLGLDRRAEGASSSSTRAWPTRCCALGRDFEVDERFRAALLISSAFDPSIEQTLLPLMGGGAAVVISDAVRESPVAILAAGRSATASRSSVACRRFSNRCCTTLRRTPRWIIWRWAARPSPASSAARLPRHVKRRADHQSLRPDRDHDRRGVASRRRRRRRPGHSDRPSDGELSGLCAGRWSGAVPPAWSASSTSRGWVWRAAICGARR